MTQPKKTIQIILSSSDDVAIDRNTFSNLIRKLDRIYERRGIRIKLIEHSDEFAPNSEELEKYNSQVKSSDIFVALFYLNAGKLTIREFNTASEEFLKTNKNPKVYVFCKNLQEGESESKELEDFKQLLYQELGHYWINYNNDDSIQFEFVMQLLHVENDLDSLKLEDGEIKLDGESIVKMDKLNFAITETEYQKFQSELDDISEEINNARFNIKKYPDDNQFKDKLQKYEEKYNNLKGKFILHQELIFNTAKQVAQLYGRKITDRMHRAIEAFNNGDVLEAKKNLKDVLPDANQIHSQLRQCEEIHKQIKLNAINSIEELSLRASILLTDNSIPIENRILDAKESFQKAYEIALNIDYEQEKYANFITKYSDFLIDFAFYDEAKILLQRLTKLNENLYGYNHIRTARSYNNLGYVYSCLDKYKHALKYYNKVLKIRIATLSENHPEIATTYNNIGSVYNSLGKYKIGLVFYKKALDFLKKSYGENHINIANSYNNIGAIYDAIGKFNQALVYYNKALDIRKNLLGENHLEIATSYNNIGFTYRSTGDYNKALDYYNKALNIYIYNLGETHIKTISLYNNIGFAYYSNGNTVLALSYFKKAINLLQEVSSEECTIKATSYYNMGVVYNSQGLYELAINSYNKALYIHKTISTEDSPIISSIYNKIGIAYLSCHKYRKALEYCTKALNIRKKIFGTNNPNTATSINDIGSIYRRQKRYELALKYYFTALEIYKNKLGNNHPNVALTYENIGLVYACQGLYNLALEVYINALNIYIHHFGSEHQNTIKTKKTINLIKQKMNQSV